MSVREERAPGVIRERGMKEFNLKNFPINGNLICIFRYIPEYLTY